MASNTTSSGSTMPRQSIGFKRKENKIKKLANFIGNAKAHPVFVDEMKRRRTHHVSSQFFVVAEELAR
jgi:hypothetical protein